MCSTLREAEGQDGRRDQPGWPGIFGAGGASESLDFELHSLENFRGCTLGDRDVRGDVGFCERSDPTVGVVSSLLSGKGKWSSVSRDGCFNGDATHFQRDCNASKDMGKRTSGKGNPSKSWSI